MKPVWFIQRCPEGYPYIAFINWDRNKHSRLRLIINLGFGHIYFRWRSAYVQAKKRVFLEWHTDAET